MYKELLATDHFEITLPHALSSNERQLLTLFYQPLTGAEPISLYLTLWAEGEDHSSGEGTHYYLMNVLGTSIRKIFEARIALEAIGLLRTWRKDDGDRRHFIYELVCPLDANAFFADPLLSMFLFSKIGEQAYRKLRQRYIKPVDKRDFQEVTRTFTDVYKPVYSDLSVESFDGNAEKQGYPFYYEQFDFDLLRAGLSEQLVPSSALTVEARELIAKLAFLYHLSPLEMQKVVILALDEAMKLPPERLKKAAADYYKISISKEAPKLGKTFRDESLKLPEIKKSKEDDLLKYYETTSPIDHLRNINNGKEPTTYTRELVENLYLIHGMSIGVVNVLIDYVMLQTDKKLPKNFVETIADHWNRKDIKTAKQAMEIARLEHDKYKKTKFSEDQEKSTTTTIQGTGYEATTYEFLKRMNNGKEPFSSTVELAQSLVQQYRMPNDVVNVLIEYVMKETDMKFPKKYVEQVAEHWIRKDVKTVQQAQKIIRDNEAKANPKSSPNKMINKRQAKYVEKKPKWFDGNKESNTNEAFDVDKEQQELMKKMGIIDG